MGTNHWSRHDVRVATARSQRMFPLAEDASSNARRWAAPAYGRGDCPKEQTMLSRNPRLLTPGPLALAPEVKASMQSDLGSRDFAFRQVTRDIRRAIQDLAGAGPDYTTVLMQGSGTFAIEAVLSTLVKDTDKVLVCA